MLGGAGWSWLEMGARFGNTPFLIKFQTLEYLKNTILTEHLQATVSVSVYEVDSSIFCDILQRK